MLPPVSVSGCIKEGRGRCH